MPIEGLIASWPLAADGRAEAGGRDAVPTGNVRFGRSADPAWAGRVARIERGAGWLEAPRLGGLGTGDFSLAAWVRPSDRGTAALGDIASSFDPDQRRGFTLGFQHSDTCGSHRNDRNLFFGLDAATEPRWTDHGSPAAAAVMIYALVAYDGALYAATWEEGGEHPVGHVYRLDDGRWVDCGVPWDCNAVTRLAVHDGRLYAGVSRVLGGGSGRPDSANQQPGGRILRYEGGTEWSDCGQLDGADSVAGLVPFDGQLYAIPLYSQGLYRMTRSGDWESCGTPGRRLLALGVYDGALYGAGNDHADVASAIEQTRKGIVVPAQASTGGGGVFRFDGTTWVDCGMQRDTTQVYSIETHGGLLHISTWPTGLVYRGDGRSGEWTNVGRLGDETEVMALASYNGMLYAGTLPHARVYRLDRDGEWAALRTLDDTPDVMYRRAHAMGVFGGRLFCGTLPAASVHSMETGLAVSHDRALAGGWHHVAAVRQGDRIGLHLDGAEVASGAAPDGVGTLDLGADRALRIGGGPQAGFDGELADVRLYDRALGGTEIAELAVRPGA